ncbi:MAG: hypothetical protein ACRCWF_12960 [Beijerinckiaceae bacterium]
MLFTLPILIAAGLALFIVRSQLLRVAIQETGGENMYASPLMGALSGWSSLFGVITLAVSALVSQGLLWGLGLIVLGIVLGVVMAAFVLPLLGTTVALGNLGGEGNKSIVAFNRAYGHFIAFAVGALALVSLYAILSFRF